MMASHENVIWFGYLYIHLASETRDGKDVGGEKSAVNMEVTNRRRNSGSC